MKYPRVSINYSRVHINLQGLHINSWKKWPNSVISPASAADGWIDLIGIKLRKGKFGSRQEWNSIYNYLIKLLNCDFTSTRYDSEMKSNRRTNLEQKLIESLVFVLLLIWPLHCVTKTFVSTGNFTVVTNDWQRESLTQVSIIQYNRYRVRNSVW